MILCRVMGTVVATQKSETLRVHKMLIVRPVGPDGSPAGGDILALDTVDAGTGDTVLVVQGGGLAAQILRRSDVPSGSIIVAVVDGIDIPP